MTAPVGTGPAGGGGRPPPQARAGPRLRCPSPGRSRSSRAPPPPSAPCPPSSPGSAREPREPVELWFLCRAKPQQKPLSAGAFPVRSHRCRPPCPPLSPGSAGPPRGQHPPPIPPAWRCEAAASRTCVQGRRRRGWVGFFSPGGTGFCWLTLPWNSRLGGPFGDPGGSLFSPALMAEGLAAAAGPRHLLLRIPEMHFGCSPRRGTSCCCSRPGGSEAIPRGVAVGVQEPSSALGTPPPRRGTLAPIHGRVPPAPVASEQLAGGTLGSGSWLALRQAGSPVLLRCWQWLSLRIGGFLGALAPAGACTPPPWATWPLRV